MIWSQRELIFFINDIPCSIERSIEGANNNILGIDFFSEGQQQLAVRTEEICWRPIQPKQNWPEKCSTLLVCSFLLFLFVIINFYCLDEGEATESSLNDADLERDSASERLRHAAHGDAPPWAAQLLAEFADMRLLAERRHREGEARARATDALLIKVLNY